MAVIGSLSVKLGLVTVEWDTATAKAKQQAKDLQKTFGDLTDNLKNLHSKFKELGGAFSVGAIGLTALMSSTLAFGNEIKDLSESFGISIEKTLQFRDAVQTSGGNADTAGKLIAKMFGKIEEARSGNEVAISQMERLKINFQDLQKLTPEQAINRVAEGLNGLKDPIQRTKAVMDILGRAGVGLNIEGLTESLHKSTAEWADHAEALKRFGKTADNLKTSMDNLKIAFADLVKPFLGEGLVSIEKFKALLVTMSSAYLINQFKLLAVAILTVVNAIKTGAAITGAVALSLGNVVVALSTILVLLGSFAYFSKGPSLEDQLAELEKARKNLETLKTRKIAPLSVATQDFPALTNEQKITENLKQQEKIRQLIRDRDNPAKQEAAEKVATARRESEAMQAKLDMQKQMLGFDQRSGQLKIDALTQDQYSIDLAQIKITQEQDLAKAEATKKSELSKANLSALQRNYINEEYQTSLAAANQKANQAASLLAAKREKEIANFIQTIVVMDEITALQSKENNLKLESVNLGQFEAQSKQNLLTLEKDLLTIKQKQEKETIAAGTSVEKIAQINAIAERERLDAKAKAKTAQDVLVAGVKKENDLLELQLAFTKETTKFEVSRLELERQRGYMTTVEYDTLVEQLALMQKIAGFAERRKEAEKNNAAGFERDRDIAKINAEEEAEIKLSEVRTQTIKIEEERRTNFSDGWNKAFAKYAEDATNYGKMGADAFASVVGSMESAIDNFVKTGKLGFADFTKSVIQNLLAIEIKMQASKLLRAGLKMFGGGGGSLIAAGDMYPGFASGGDVTAGAPILVGERGPEIIIPKNSGTVIPNNQLSSSLGGQQVVYNGPYIASMSAIDTQSAVQFLANNKLGVWAANQSASRSMPTSR